MSKRRILKNRYCIGANISEQLFLALLKQFCKGRIPDHACKVINRWGKKRGERKLSRPATTDYFIRIGNHLFEHVLITAMNSGLPDGFDFRQPLQNGGMRVIDAVMLLVRADVYGNLDNESFARATMQAGMGRGGIRGLDRQYVALLAKRSKKGNGLSADTFNAHFAAVVMRRFYFSIGAREVFGHAEGFFAANPLPRKAEKRTKVIKVRKNQGLITLTFQRPTEPSAESLPPTFVIPIEYITHSTFWNPQLLRRSTQSRF